MPIFEYNAGNHSLKRALSNALATNEVERIGDVIPIVCAANCLQPDGQNDNGWNQGLLFLNPSQVWLQPPGYLTQMTRRHYQPNLVASAIVGFAEKLSVNAKRSDDSRTLVLQVVNPTDDPCPTRIELTGFTPTNPVASVEQLAGPLDARNTAEAPRAIIPTRSDWRRNGWDQGPPTTTFPPGRSPTSGSTATAVRVTLAQRSARLCSQEIRGDQPTSAVIRVMSARESVGPVGRGNEGSTATVTGRPLKAIKQSSPAPTGCD